MVNKNLDCDPTAVSNYIVDYAKSENSKLTNLKLQKILFFLQAAFLVEHDTSLMNVKFSRWQYGPVSSEVYFNFNDRGAAPITERASVLDIENFSFSVPKLKDVSKDIKRELKKYLDVLFSYSASQLVKETHRESIWSDYKEEISHRMAPEYTNAEIKEYFDNHKEERIWISTQKQ